MPKITGTIAWVRRRWALPWIQFTTALTFTGRTHWMAWKSVVKSPPFGTSVAQLKSVPAVVTGRGTWLEFTSGE